MVSSYPTSCQSQVDERRAYCCREGVEAEYSAARGGGLCLSPARCYGIRGLPQATRCDPKPQHALLARAPAQTCGLLPNPTASDSPWAARQQCQRSQFPSIEAGATVRLDVVVAMLETGTVRPG